MNKFSIASLALILMSGTALAETFTVTVTNTLKDELLAPIVVTSAANDAHFFSGSYVTPAAEHQILTGDPAKVVASIGMHGAAVGHGMDGPPGVLLAPGASVTFDVDTEATSLRILAMVAPTKVPDNYVTNVVDIHTAMGTSVALNRFDIGHDEGSMMDRLVSEGGASVTIARR
jgi:hypothetical protein